ncbi:MAG: cobyric acid synthase CobQ, partial [Clostridiales Family XIII bacterium]|jgi:adenosylcobyric acid synthase|nr:cobyric acid synthase CobQ [Clostridiales Family XIII bacterium]
VIRLPKISNFTDFTALEATEGVGLYYVDGVRALGRPDMIILPGTKNTVADMKWLRQSGLEAAILRCAEQGAPVFGVCGGYQMLGLTVRDAENTEGGGEIAGMGLLPIHTEFIPEKRRSRSRGTITGALGAFAALNGATVEGYEIHMGVSRSADGAAPLLRLDGGAADGCAGGNIAGTYLHGFFDSYTCRDALIAALCERKGIAAPGARSFDFASYKQEQFDALAAAVREHLDMSFIYRVLERRD